MIEKMTLLHHGPSGAGHSQTKQSAQLTKSILATAFSACITLLFIVKHLLLSRLVSEYLVFSIPYLISNSALLTLLLLSLKNRPKDVHDGSAIFFFVLLVANFPAISDLLGMKLADYRHINPHIASAAEYFSVAAVPFYVAAVINLGKRISILPEARALQTKGIYRFSRHPIYSTYIYWYILQIFILQSWTIAVVSAAQALMQIARAQYEEGILEKNFPEYADYRNRVWWVGPNLFHPWKAFFAGQSRPRKTEA